MKRVFILLSIILSSSITSNAQKNSFEFSKDNLFLTVKTLYSNDTSISLFGNNDSLCLEKPLQISININYIVNIEFLTNVRTIERGSSVLNHEIKIFIDKNSEIQYYALMMKADKFEFSAAIKEYDRLMNIISK